MDVLTVGAEQCYTHTVFVAIKGVLASEALLVSGTIASEASGAADVAEGACGINKIGCIYALEAVVAG